MSKNKESLKDFMIDGVIYGCTSSYAGYVKLDVNDAVTIDLPGRTVVLNDIGYRIMSVAEHEVRLKWAIKSLSILEDMEDEGDCDMTLIRVPLERFRKLDDYTADITVLYQMVPVSEVDLLLNKELVEPFISDCTEPIGEFEVKHTKSETCLTAFYKIVEDLGS